MLLRSNRKNRLGDQLQLDRKTTIKYETIRKNQTLGAFTDDESE